MGGKILNDKKRENKGIKNVFFHTRRKNYVLASPKLSSLFSQETSETEEH